MVTSDPSLGEIMGLFLLKRMLTGPLFSTLVLLCLKVFLKQINTVLVISMQSDVIGLNEDND